MPPEGQPEERYQPLALISVVLVALLGFAVFFLSFLVAPLAILAVFYVGFAASDRSKRSDGPPPAPGAEPLPGEPVAVAPTPVNRMQAEAEARRAVMDRQDEDAGQAAYGPRPTPTRPAG